jgi:hypothetical protein
MRFGFGVQMRGAAGGGNAAARGPLPFFVTKPYKIFTRHPSPGPWRQRLLAFVFVLSFLVLLFGLLYSRALRFGSALHLLYMALYGCRGLPKESQCTAAQS